MAKINKIIHAAVHPEKNVPIEPPVIVGIKELTKKVPKVRTIAKNKNNIGNLLSLIFQVPVRRFELPTPSL